MDAICKTHLTLIKGLSLMDNTHRELMKIAMIEAEKAQNKGEVPIGAVLVADNKI
jgi:tRNA(Arg) A34 adenosine deaminase TadA